MQYSKAEEQGIDNLKGGLSSPSHFLSRLGLRVEHKGIAIRGN
jgi:hypothetical protein